MSADDPVIDFKSADRFRVDGTPPIEVVAFGGDAPFVALQIGQEHDGKFSLILRSLDRARQLSDALLAAIAFAQANRST